MNNQNYVISLVKSAVSRWRRPENLRLFTAVHNPDPGRAQEQVPAIGALEKAKEFLGLVGNDGQKGLFPGVLKKIKGDKSLTFDRVLPPYDAGFSSAPEVLYRGTLRPPQNSYSSSYSKDLKSHGSPNPRIAAAYGNLSGTPYSFVNRHSVKNPERQAYTNDFGLENNEVGRTFNQLLNSEINNAKIMGLRRIPKSVPHELMYETWLTPAKNSFIDRIITKRTPDTVKYSPFPDTPSWNKLSENFGKSITPIPLGHPLRSFFSNYKKRQNMLQSQERYRVNNLVNRWMSGLEERGRLDPETGNISRLIKFLSNERFKDNPVYSAASYRLRRGN